ALAAGRAGDDGRPLVEAEQLVVRHPAERPGDAVAERAVAGDYERQTARCLDELEHALLRREPTGVEDVRRLVRLARRGGDVDAGRDHADVARAEAPGG